jgi:GNAT superfamily N-acetyltransferase
LNKPIIIREATIDDMEVLLNFEQGVILAEHVFDTTLKPDPNYYYDLKAMISDQQVHLIIAENDGEVIASGYGQIEKAKHYLQHKQSVYLGFMYVKPEWRGKGINQMIIERLKQWAMSKSITELRLDVYDENVSAITAYEKAGFSKLMVQMRMGLPKKISNV